jgi:tetratricopeptide (TPR) repeat protein
VPYDLFISYSRRDNERGQVAELIAQIESSFRAFAGREIRFFFDTHEILGMDDWRKKIQRSLRESHLFLAVLSPDYIASPYCRWEWEDYVRYEAMRQCLGEGVAPVFFVTLPDDATTRTDPALARWMDEIHQRQAFDLRSWHEHGEKALQEAHVRTTLEQLHASVRERLDRSERALRSPNNLIKHNSAFVGRVHELTELRNVLSRNKLGVVGARQGKALGPVAVQGLGGMGKTELALAYAHAFAWDYPGGRWQIPCEYTGDLRLALSRLAGPMQFEFTEDEKKDLALQFERVLRELERRERSLLILDNVSDPHLLEPEYLDRLPRDGRVDLIATTRLAPTAIPGSAQDLTFIAVDEMPEEDALALMRSHQPEGRFASQDEENEARRIVQLLRGFTLAVETAAIYLGRHPEPQACLLFREHLSPDLFRESEQAATDPTVAVRHRVRSLDETLAFTLATLTPEAMHLLTFAALLPADQVAVPWLRVLGAERYPDFEDSEGMAFRQPMELLLGLRLFQPGEAVDVDGHLLIARMHRLVQDLIRQKTAAEELAARQKAVDKLVRERDAALQKTTVWIKARWELEPLTALASLWDDANHPGAAWLLGQAGLRWLDLAEWGHAEPLMRRALAIDEQSFEPDHPIVATRLNNLAGLLDATNRLAEAEPLFRRVIAILEKNDPERQPNYAGSLNNLATLLQATNRLSEAEPLYRRSLAIDEQSYGPDHSNVAIRLNNLAQLLQATNRLAEAEPLLRRALTILEQSLGENHPNVATALSNLAGLLQATNRLAEVEPLLHRALQIKEQSFGPDHPDVAIHLNNLAQLLQATNRLAEAEPLMRRALAIDENSLGPEHPNVARQLNNLAGLLQATNRLAEAEPLMRRALAIDEQSYGPDHPEVATDLNNLAQLLQATNRLAEAEPLLRRVIAILEKNDPERQPNYAGSLNNLARLLNATNRLAEAEPLFRRALAIDERSHGPDHPEVAIHLNNLALLLQATNRLAEAEVLYRRALAIGEKSLGSDHPNIASTLDNLAQLLRATNRQAEAEPLLRRALAIDEQSLGSEHPNVAIHLNNLAQLLEATNRLAEAEPLMRRALEIDERNYGPDHPDVTGALNNLARLLHDTNRLAEAEPLYRRNMEILLKFTRATGHPHPNLKAAVNNYGVLLHKMGRSREQILATLHKMAPEFY